jgi:hypothetical protein
MTVRCIRWSLATIVLMLLGCRRPTSATIEPPGDITSRNARDYLALEQREQAIDRTVWEREMEAEAYEDIWIQLWDSLNPTTNPVAAWQQFFGGTPILPVESGRRLRPWNIEETGFLAALRPLPEQESGRWAALLQAWHQGHWVLDRTEWHLTDHTPARAGVAAHSTIHFRLPASRVDPPERILVEGDLEVDWEPGPPPVSPHSIRVIHARCLRRKGHVPFQLRQESSLPLNASGFSDPLLALDGDGDGWTDFLTVGSRQWWHNETNSEVDSPMSRLLVPRTFNPLPEASVWAAAFSDLDGDGVADLVLAERNGLSIVRGIPGVGFGTQPPQRLWTAPLPLQHPQVMAIGDVDGDGLPDIWLAQYKLPYLGGQFPTPFDDANDGFPSYLLHNEGSQFRDITKGSGLETKRHRRAYSASLVDLSGSGRLDLVQVSDFAGLDIFRSTGPGTFEDVTAHLGDRRHSFGMSHLIADFNRDGLPDLWMVGMNSPTVDRLNRFGLERSNSVATIRRRAAMTYGNRLFLSQTTRPGDLDAQEGAQLRPLAETGWSWGAAWADFGNERRSEWVVAAGHDTQASTRDYERQFWRHDVDVATSTNNAVADFYFRSVTGHRRAAKASYGGWQHNSLILESAPGEWTDVGWLLGITFPADCRNLVVDDIDGDGRLDVILLTEETWPTRQRRLLVFHNELPTTGHWIGLRLDAGHQCPVGARVVLDDSSGRQTRWILAGDGYRSQSAPAVQFGLGTNQVLGITVHWPGGQTTALTHPVMDQWQSVTQPTGRSRRPMP